MVTRKKKRLVPIRSLRSKLDMLFNRYIRERDGKCVLCGSTEKLQCSHYYGKRARPKTRWNELNAHAMCASCHFKHHHGAEGDYAFFMFATYGADAMAFLKKVSLEYYPLNRDDYLLLIDHYIKKGKEL